MSKAPQEAKRVVENTSIRDSVRSEALEGIISRSKSGDDEASKALRQVAENTNIKKKFRHRAAKGLGERD